MLNSEKIIKFIGVKNDGGVPAITYSIDGRRIKARFQNYRDETIKNLEFIHFICSKGEEDFKVLKGLADTLLDCREELEFYQRVILKKQIGDIEIIKEEENSNTFILISDTGAGKSYFLSRLLSDILKQHIEGITFEEIKKIISGNKETTKCAVKFRFNNEFDDADKNRLSVIYEHKGEIEIKWVAQELVLEGFSKFIKQRKRSNVLPRQCLQATFKLERVVSEETLKDINDYLIRVYENLGELRDELRTTEIDTFSNQVFEKIYPEFQARLLEDKKIDISTENLLNELKFIKENFSLINKATMIFNIECDKSFEILDTIGINHGCCTSNILDIRLKRISSMLVENKNANIIFVMDSTDLVRLTLEPIELLKQYGRFNTTKFVLSKTDILSEDEFSDIDTLLDEKIKDNDLLDTDILNYIRNNIYLSNDQLAWKKIINTENLNLNFENNNLTIYKENNYSLFRDCNFEVNKFSGYIREHFTNIHWSTFEAYIRKVTEGRDSHVDKYGNEYSISNTIRDIFTATYKNEELTQDLKIRLNKDVNISELNEMKNKFWSALGKSAYIYFIDNNKSELKEIYDLRKNRDATKKYKNSMTKDRLIIFKALYDFNPIDLNNIFKELIEASLRIAISD